MKTKNLFARTAIAIDDARLKSFSKISLTVLICLSLGLTGCKTTDRGQQAAMKMTTQSEANNNWLRVQVDASLSPDTAWQKIVDSATDDYSSLEMVDAASGYVRSVYKLRRFYPGLQYEFDVRTRFICSISSKTPLVYKMKIESECMKPNSTDPTDRDWQPFQQVFKEDAQLVEELQSRLGVK